MALFGQTGILVRVVATCQFPVARNKRRGDSLGYQCMCVREYFCILFGLDSGGSVCQQCYLPVGKLAKGNSLAYSRQWFPLDNIPQ